MAQSHLQRRFAYSRPPRRQGIDGLKEGIFEAQGRPAMKMQVAEGCSLFHINSFVCGASEFSTPP